MTIKDQLIKIRMQLSKVLFNFSEVTTADGIVIIYEGEIAEGLEVFTYDVDGNKIVLADGIYTITSDDKTLEIEVVEGKVASVKDITEAEPEVETPAEEPIVETEMSVVTPDKNDQKFSELNSKITQLAEVVNKLNEVVLKFGLEKPVVDAKVIEVNDTKVSTSKASKYFTK